MENDELSGIYVFKEKNGEHKYYLLQKVFKWFKY